VINLPNTEDLASAATRNMNISCTIQDEEMLVTHEAGSFTLLPLVLKAFN
jgi:uncharacterized protein YaeQ